MANPIDVHVGNRIKLLRRSLNLSQTGLASELGVTFQQVQKYENGNNRISASKLYLIAVALGVTPDFFFEGLLGVEGDNELQEQSLKTTRAASLISKIQDEPTTTALFELIRAMASLEAAE